jgi:hypothetical protein
MISPAADNRVRREQALILRDAIDLEDERRTRHIRHAPDGLILEDDPGFPAGHAADNAAVGKVLKV